MFHNKYKTFLKYVRRNNVNFFDFIQKYVTHKKIVLPKVNNLKSIHKTYSLALGEKVATIHPP